MYDICQIANAYELLIDPTRRREYDLSVKQQYLGTQARFVEAQKEMHRVVTHRPHGPHDAILWESHGTMTQLAQTMTRLVRELKAIPDEGERERQKEFDSLRRRVEYLQGHVTHDANRIHDLRSKLEQEEKKARNAVTDQKIISYIRVDLLRKAHGTLDQGLQYFRGFASLTLDDTDTDESTISDVRPAQAAKGRKVMQDAQ